MNVKNILKKENLIGAAGLGAGSLSAEILVSKVSPMLPEQASKFASALPILAGLVLQNSKGILGSLGKGMIAQGISATAKGFIPEETKSTLGIGGNEVLMGNVMMGEQDEFDSASLGGLTSDSYDFTSGTSGEMDY